MSLNRQRVSVHITTRTSVGEALATGN